MPGYPARFYVLPDRKVKLSNDRNKIWIRQPLPGVSKEDLNLKAHEDGFDLDFKAERMDPALKTIILGEKIDPATVRATFENGVLSLEASIKNPDQPRRLEVS